MSHGPVCVKKKSYADFFFWQIHYTAAKTKVLHTPAKEVQPATELLKQFYTALCSSITVGFDSATKTDIRRLLRTVSNSERINGASLSSLQELYNSRVRKRGKKVTLDPTHPAHSLFELLPFGRLYRSLRLYRSFLYWKLLTPRQIPCVQTHLAIKLFLILIQFDCEQEKIVQFSVC